MLARRTVLALVLLALAGCRSIGPGTVARDRFDYSTAITESWKRQSLLNIVKLRYLDPPIYVDVGQIVASYQMEIYGSVGADFSVESGGDSVVGRVDGRYIDRPTITYTPMTGAKFVAGLITPMPPAAVFSAIQAGWPAETMVTVGLASINGLSNARVGLQGNTPADPRFLRVAALMGSLQRDGGVSLRVIPQTTQGDGDRVALIIPFHPPSAEFDAPRAELRALLGLDPTASEFYLYSGGLPRNSSEITVQTRSILHVTQMMAAHVEVPVVDVDEQRALPGATTAKPAADGLRIRSSPERPAESFAAVNYRGQWFWIDDRDLVSKRAFSLLMLLFTMTDTSGEGRPPVLTIST
ncbi:MAG: hypothetical protein H7067_13920 [Burkholderiales bacterium]|nr:hypothetical protein [Opitutaceae bacterium]